MAIDHALLCGGASGGALPPVVMDRTPLRMWGTHANVHLRVEDVRAGLWDSLPPLLLDLLDVAIYVYAGDQAVSRGGPHDERFGTRWRRRLHYALPVRELDAWRPPEVLATLTETLSFLTEDEYAFHFEAAREAEPAQSYIEFEGGRFSGSIEEVVLFSGGADSLAGAARSVVRDRRHVLLVSHRSNPKLEPSVRHLVRHLSERTGGPRPVFLPVHAHKSAGLTRDFNQRARSFLYAALGAVAASSLGLDRCSFYENGVTSINLPPVSQVVGSRASRSTHPLFLQRMAGFVSALVRRPFSFDTPFQWMTKTEVLRVLADSGCGDLIGSSRSCAHPRRASDAHPACGTCSQCIDRRFAVLAAGLESEDPGGGYAVDLLIGPRQPGLQQTMMAAYAELARQTARLSPPQLFRRFGELTRVLPALAGPPESAAIRVHQLLHRHANEVVGVLSRATAHFARQLLDRELPATCLLSMAFNRDGGDHEVLPESSENAPRVGPIGGATPNVFRKCGQGWDISFQGRQTRMVKPGRGLVYLHLLLQQPKRRFPAEELLRLATDEPREERGPGEETIDDEARQDYEREARDYVARIAQADRDQDAGLAAQLRAEFADLMGQLRTAKTLGGRTRHEPRARKQARDAVGNAVRRALSAIRRVHPELAEHLSPPDLHVGNESWYAPSADTEWET